MRGQGKGTDGSAGGTEGRVDGQQPAGDAQSRPASAGTLDAGKYNASMSRLSEIFRGISEKADEVMLTRCPYKDARSVCTARFGCRNQFFTRDATARPICAGSDSIDYRPAWETE